MAGYNKLILVGNLTRDPEHKQLPSGQTVCRLGLAINRPYYNKQTAAMVQEVCYIDIDVWGSQADSCKQFLEKGRSILVEGRLKFDSWDDQQGQKRSKHSVVADRVIFLGSQGGQDRNDDVLAAVRSDMSHDASENSMLENSLSSQIKTIKARGRSAQPAANNNQQASFSAGEVDYADTPPFADEFPF
jgi:single-strand DNA-binding protein